MTPDAEFFLDRFHAELPVRIHSRETNDDGGPEWHPGFEAYLTDGERRWQTTRSDDLVECIHPTICSPTCEQRHRHEQGQCPTCEGSGYRQRLGRRYRRPMKRTLRLLSEVWVPKDRPRLDVLLVAFGLNDGNPGLTAHSLRGTYSYMWSLDRAERFIAYALREARSRYSESEATHGRSESQLMAEAA